jgi:hypothetical protein
MGGTCANPGCSAKFLYLHEGKLFIAPSADAAIRHIWLCGNCARTFTLTGNQVDGVSLVVVPSRCAKAAAHDGGERGIEKAG